jgi:hypothetical protein
MAQRDAKFQEVWRLAERLSRCDKARLALQLQMQVASGGYRISDAAPYKSALGALKEYGTAPSAEEIDEARREAWSNFPRQDLEC